MVNNVEVYSRSTVDIAGEDITDARFIGHLDPGRTRLNLNSALTKGNNDVQDYFRFRLSDNSPVGLSVQKQDGVRLQVLNRGGQVIADSAAKSGTLKDKYNELLQTKADLKKGDYFVKVTRDLGVPRSAVLTYSVQLRTSVDIDSFREDFDSTETPARTTAQSIATSQTLAISQSAGLLAQYINKTA